MPRFSFHFEWLNETHLRLTSNQTQQTDENQAIHLGQLAYQLRHNAPPYIRQAVSGFSHLLIEIEPAIQDSELENWLKNQIEQFSAEETNPRIWRIAVDYNGEDLADVAKQLDLSVQQVIERHTQTAWRVQALGFAPGFAYMGDAPQALRLPRRASPRQEVPAGSVALAEQFSAIYPAASPGGWHLIGRTAQPVFDWLRTPPGIFQLGDSVRFYDINNPSNTPSNNPRDTR